jgi:dTDP-4-amino-4,6-dideoxygalactose transaminase
MQVPFLDLKAQYVTIREELLPALEAVLDSQQFAIGPAVVELEKQIAAYSSCASAVGVSSGSDALLVSLMALDIGPGDEVIVPSFTFFATAGSVWRLGARPAFVDIEPDTYNIDPAAVAAAVTERTKAILPVHLYGQMAEMDAILDVAHRHKLHVIEDTAQSIGATYKGKRACSLGTTGCLSFYPTKNLGGIGDGGMVLTQDPELAMKVTWLRIHGSGGNSYFHKYVGGCFRLDNLQAAALGVKFKHLEAWTDKRRAHAQRYDELLSGCDEIVRPVSRPYNRHIYNLYVIRARRRNDLQTYLKEQGVGTAIYYPLPLHQQECFELLGYKRGDLPVSERAAEEVLALPIYPELTDAQLLYVAEKIKAFYARR